MLKETFFINGVDMRTLGVHLQRPIEISGLVRDVETVSIEGRNGDLIFDRGRYLNRKGKADCYALSKGNVLEKINLVNAVLFEKMGYIELKQSEDPTHFWKARITNGAQIQQRLSTLNPFTIEFDIMPQHYTYEGLEKTSYETANIALTNPNTGVTSPEIKAYGSGTGTLIVNDVRIDFLHLHVFSTTIDCESGAIYSERGNESKNVIIPGNEFPKLKVGENNIEFSGGITRIKIQPRWWDL